MLARIRRTLDLDKLDWPLWHLHPSARLYSQTFRHFERETGGTSFFFFFLFISAKRLAAAESQGGHVSHSPSDASLNATSHAVTTRVSPAPPSLSPPIYSGLGAQGPCPTISILAVRSASPKMARGHPVTQISDHARKTVPVTILMVNCIGSFSGALGWR